MGAEDGKTVAVTEYNATDMTVISLFGDKQILHKAESIFKYPEHALYGKFECLPYRHWFRSLARKTNRRGKLVFTAIQL